MDGLTRWIIVAARQVKLAVGEVEPKLGKRVHASLAQQVTCVRVLRVSSHLRLIPAHVASYSSSNAISLRVLLTTRLVA